VAFPICSGSFSRFGCGFNRGWQFQFGLFRSAMVVMVQRLDATQLLLPSVADRPHVFGARPQGMPESFLVVMAGVWQNYPRPSCPILATP
jgi:hypothetical protein